MSMPFMSVLAAQDPIGHVIDHPRLIADNGLWILTNHMIIMGIAALLMLLIFPAMTKRYRSGELVPTGTRNLFEAVMVYIREQIAKPVLGARADTFMPLLWTLFFFILFCNLLGMLPLDVIQKAIFHAIGQDDLYPIYGTPTANPYVTAMLALISFVAIQGFALKANGVGPYLKHFLGGAPWYMAPVMIPVEIIGMLVKPFALFLRLAANMTAGHILLAVLIGFPALAAAGMNSYGMGVAIGIPAVLGAAAISCLELFVAFLQAYLFTFLTALFIGQMAPHEHHHHDQDMARDHKEDRGPGEFAAPAHH
jgi:F-type H+-transporting ATPase subunit a